MNCGVIGRDEAVAKSNGNLAFDNPSYTEAAKVFTVRLFIEFSGFQGCLPLVLMFDMKQDENLSAADEAVKSSQLMESLDVFISIKLKPKQPSKASIFARTFGLS